jgi:hypothetical protein
MTSLPNEPSEDNERGSNNLSPSALAGQSQPQSDLPVSSTALKQTIDVVDEPEASQWSIYDAVPTDWSEHMASLARWKQSDLVPNVPLTWLTIPGSDPITGIGNDRDEVRPVFDRNLKVTAIICSQTCDLGATAPGDSHPFVLLAPLVPSSSIPKPADRKLAIEGKIGYLVKTLPPPVPDKLELNDPSHDEASSPSRGGRETWYADLRLIFPASKALLLQGNPLQGFPTERERLAFAETLALKFRRAALDEALSEKLPRALQRFVKDNGHRKQEFAKVEQVRLLILSGDRLLPDRAQLYVLTDGVTLSDAEQETWTRFQQTADELLAAAEIVLGPMVHSDVNKLSAAKYRVSVPVRCELLGPVNWF